VLGKAGALSTTLPATLRGVTVSRNQRLLIPAYFYPSGSQWEEMCDALESLAAAVIIMNPGSGPGTAVDANYRSAIGICHSKGQTVIGYVFTAYRRRSLSAVKADIDRFFRLYPEIDGIFIDQISTEDAPAIKTYYRKLYTHVKARSPDALVVGNPGAAAPTPWQADDPVVADVLVIFEGPAEHYGKWEPPAWVSSRPAGAFAHLVHTSANPAQTISVCAASQQKNAGWIYVTQGVMDNPWDVPPEPAMYACRSLQRQSVVEA
jgi:hypothetical protein